MPSSKTSPPLIGENLLLKGPGAAQVLQGVLQSQERASQLLLCTSVSLETSSGLIRGKEGWAGEGIIHPHPISAC